VWLLVAKKATAQQYMVEIHQLVVALLVLQEVVHREAVGTAPAAVQDMLPTVTIAVSVPAVQRYSVAVIV
jgi:hypothetical protein